MPASRRAMAMTLIPRSWPSSPALARRTRIFFLEKRRFFVFTEDPLQDAADFSHRRICLDGIDDERHEILPACRGGFAPVERRRPAALVALPPERLELPDLSFFDFGSYLQDLDRFLGFREFVQADHDLFLFLDGPLIPLGAPRDLVLRESLADRLDHPAQIVDSFEVVVHILL